MPTCELIQQTLSAWNQWGINNKIMYNEFEQDFTHRIVKCMKEQNSDDKRDCTRLFSHFHSLIIYAYSKQQCENVKNIKQNLEVIDGECNLTDYQIIEQLYHCFISCNFEPEPNDSEQDVTAMMCTLQECKIKITLGQMINIADEIQKSNDNK